VNGVYILRFCDGTYDENTVFSLEPSKSSYSEDKLIDTHDDDVPSEDIIPTSTGGIILDHLTDFFSVWLNIRVLEYGASYFCLKFILYALLGWLPYYFEHVLRYDEIQSGYLSISLEVGGTIGVLFFNGLSDFFPNRRVILIFPLFLFSSFFLALFNTTNFKTNTIIIIIFMGLIGLFLYAGDSLLAGAATQDLGEQKFASRTIGAVNGFGSIGSAVQGLVVPAIAASGWTNVFYLLVFFVMLGAFFLIPAFYRALKNDNYIVK